MSLTLTLCGPDRALMLADSGVSSDAGLVRRDGTKQWILAGGAALQYSGDEPGAAFCLGLAREAEPRGVGNLLHAISAWLDRQPVSTQAQFHVVSLDRPGLLRADARLSSGGKEPVDGQAPWRVVYAEWLTNRAKPLVLMIGGYPKMDRVARWHERREEIVRLPWAEAEAAARELFAEMVASNPAFIGGPVHELRLAASDMGAGEGSGLHATPGYTGAVGLVVGNGFLSPSTGGYVPRRTVWSGPTGTEANGTVIDFSALADQSGNPLPAFDTAPLVSLAPYNMSTAPALLYASGVTASGFTLNSYSAATASEGSAVNLPKGTPETVTAGVGTTITGVVFTATVTANYVSPAQNFSQVVNFSINGTGAGSVTINGQTNGHPYSQSTNVNVSGNPTSLTAEATWTAVSGVASISAAAKAQQISGETPMSANVTCAITEQFNS